MPAPASHDEYPHCIICNDVTDSIALPNSDIYVPHLIWLTDVPRRERKRNLMCYTCACVTLEEWGERIERKEVSIGEHHIAWETIDNMVNTPICEWSGWRAACAKFRITLKDNTTEDVEIRYNRPPRTTNDGTPIPPYADHGEQGKEKFTNAVICQWERFLQLQKTLFHLMNQIQDPQKAMTWLMTTRQISETQAAHQLGIIQEIGAHIMHQLRDSHVPIDGIREQYLREINTEPGGKLKFGPSASFANVRGGHHFSPLSPRCGEEWWCARPNCLHTAPPEAWYIGMAREQVMRSGKGLPLEACSRYKCSSCGMPWSTKTHVNLSLTDTFKPSKLLVLQKHAFDEPATTRTPTQAASRFPAAEQLSQDNFLLTAITDTNQHGGTNHLIAWVKERMLAVRSSHMATLESHVGELVRYSKELATYQDQFFTRKTQEPYTDRSIQEMNTQQNDFYAWPDEAEWKYKDDPNSFPELPWPTFDPYKNVDHDFGQNDRTSRFPVIRTRRIVNPMQIPFIHEDEWWLILHHLWTVEAASMSKM